MRNHAVGRRSRREQAAEDKGPRHGTRGPEDGFDHGLMHCDMVQWPGGPNRVAHVMELYDDGTVELKDYEGRVLARGIPGRSLRLVERYNIVGLDCLCRIAAVTEVLDRFARQRPGLTPAERQCLTAMHGMLREAMTQFRGSTAPEQFPTVPAAERLRPLKTKMDEAWRLAHGPTASEAPPTRPTPPARGPAKPKLRRRS